MDQVDILQHFIPTEQEVIHYFHSFRIDLNILYKKNIIFKLKAFAKYVDSGKDVKALSEEDQFLIAVKFNLIFLIIKAYRFLLII